MIEVCFLGGYIYLLIFWLPFDFISYPERSLACVISYLRISAAPISSARAIASGGIAQLRPVSWSNPV
jgi:hypothetical protein